MSDEIKTPGEGSAGLGIDMVVTIVADKLDGKEIQGNIKEAVVTDFDKLLSDLTQKTQAINSTFLNISSVLTSALAKNSRASKSVDVQEFQLLSQKLNALSNMPMDAEPTTVLARQGLVAETLSKLSTVATRIPDIINPRRGSKAPLIDSESLTKNLSQGINAYNSAITSIAQSTKGVKAVDIREVQANPELYNSESVVKNTLDIAARLHEEVYEQRRKVQAEVKAVRDMRVKARHRQKLNQSLTAAGVPKLDSFVTDMELANKDNDILSISYSHPAIGSKTLHRDVVKDGVTVDDFNKQLVGGKIKEGGLTLDELMTTVYKDMRKAYGADKLQAFSITGQNTGPADFNWLMENQAKMSPSPVKDNFGKFLSDINTQRKTALKDTINMWVDFAKKELHEFGLVDSKSGGATLSNISAALKIPITAHDVTSDQEATQLIARMLNSPEGRSVAKDRFKSGGREAWLNSYKDTALERSVRAQLPEGPQQIELMEYFNNRPAAGTLKVNGDFENLIKVAEHTARLSHQQFVERLDAGRQTGPVTIKSFDPKAVSTAYENFHKTAITSIQDEVGHKLSKATPKQYSSTSSIEELANGIIADPAISDIILSIPQTYGVDKKGREAFKTRVSKKLADSISMLVDTTEPDTPFKSLTSQKDERISHIRESIYNNIMTEVASLPDAGIARANTVLPHVTKQDPGTLRATFLGGNAIGREGYDTEKLKEIFESGGYTPDIPEDAALKGNRLERLVTKYIAEKKPGFELEFTTDKQKTVNYGPVTGHPDAFGYDQKLESPFIGEIKYANKDKLAAISSHGIPLDWQAQTNTYALSTGLNENVNMKYILANLTSDTPEIKALEKEVERLESLDSTKPGSSNQALLDHNKIKLEKLRVAREAEIKLAERAASPEELATGEWADKFYKVDEIYTVDMAADKALQSKIKATIKTITGKTDLKPSGLPKDVRDYLGEVTTVPNDRVNTTLDEDIAYTSKQARQRFSQGKLVEIKGSKDYDFDIKDEVPPAPSIPASDWKPDNYAALDPAASRAKFEADIATAQKLTAKAQADILKLNRQRQAYTNLEQAGDIAGIAALEAVGPDRIVLEEKIKANEALVRSYKTQITNAEYHANKAKAETDYSSEEAVNRSAVSATVSLAESDAIELQALKDRALHLSGVNKVKPTAASMAEADVIAKKLQETDTKAGHSRLDLAKLDAPFKEPIKLADTTASLVQTESLSKFMDKPSNLQSQVDLFNKANSSIKTLWSQLHTAQGETFVDKTTKKLESLNKLIQEDIIKIDQLADKERRLGEEKTRLSYKQGKTEEDKYTLEAVKNELTRVKTQKAALTESSKQWLAEAQALADEHKPIKDYKNIQPSEQALLDNTLTDKTKVEVEKLQLRKAQLETELKKGLTKSSYHELGNVNDELRRQGVGVYGVQNKQLSKMASQYGWEALPEYTQKAGQRAPKVFDKDIELRLATDKAKQDFNDLKVSLKKEAIAIQVDIDKHGLNEDNIQKALASASKMLKYGVGNPAGYTFASLVNANIGLSPKPFGNNFSTSEYINQEKALTTREKYTGELRGGLDYVKYQKDNLDKSVSDMFSGLSNAGKSNYSTGLKHTDKLLGLEKAANKAISDLQELVEARDKLYEKSDELALAGKPGHSKNLKSAGDKLNPRIDAAEQIAVAKIATYDKAAQDEKLKFSIKNKEVQERLIKDLERETQLEREMLEIEKFQLEYKMKQKQLSLPEAQRIVGMQSDLRRVGLQPTGSEEEVLKHAKDSGYSKMDIQPGRKGNTFVEGAIGLLDWQMQWLSGVAILGSFGFALQNSIGFAKQFEAEMKNVQLITQANTYDMQLLVAGIVNLTDKYQYSASELGEALVILGQAGFKASESMQLLPGIATLATATMSTLAVAADVTTTAVEAFNVPVEKAAALSNSLAAMTIESKLDLEKLGTTFNYVAETASAAGLDVNEIGTAMGLMSNAGVRASTIGTSLRSVIGSMLSPTAKFSEALNAVGLSSDDVNPRFHSLGNILKTLRASGFSVQDAFDGLDKRIAGSVTTLISSADQWDNFEASITNTNRAFQMAEGQMDTFEAQSKRLKNNLQLALGGVGTPMLDPMKEGTALLADMMGVIGGITSKVPGGLWQALGLTVGATSALSILKAAGSGIWDIGSSIYKKSNPTPGPISPITGLPTVTQRTPLTGMERTLSTTLTTIFDPKMLAVAAATSAAYMIGSKVYAEMSGQAGVDRVTTLTDRLTTESAQIKQHVALYKSAAYGTQAWADARERLVSLGMPDRFWETNELEAFSARASMQAREAQELILPAQMKRANSSVMRKKYALSMNEEERSNYEKSTAQELLDGLKLKGMAYTTNEDYIANFLSDQGMTGHDPDFRKAKIRAEFSQLREGVINSEGFERTRLGEIRGRLRDLDEARQESTLRYDESNMARDFAAAHEHDPWGATTEAYEKFKVEWKKKKGKNNQAGYTKEMENLLPELQAVKGADEEVFTGTQSSINKQIDTWYADIKGKKEKLTAYQSKKVITPLDKEMIEDLKSQVEILEKQAVTLSKTQIITTLLPKIAKYEATMIADLAYAVGSQKELIGEVGAANFSDFQKKAVEVSKKREAALNTHIAKDKKNVELRKTINLYFDLEMKELTEGEILKSVQKVEGYLEKQRSHIRAALNISTEGYKEDFETFKSARTVEAERALYDFDLSADSYINVPGKYTGNDNSTNLTWMPTLSEAKREEMKLSMEQEIFLAKSLMQNKVYQEKRSMLQKEYEDKLAVSAKMGGADQEVGLKRKLEIDKKYSEEITALDKGRREEIRQNIDFEVQQYGKVVKAIQATKKAHEDTAMAMDKTIAKLEALAGKSDSTKPADTAQSLNIDITRLGEKMLEARRAGDNTLAGKYLEEMTAKADKVGEIGGADGISNAAGTLKQFKNWDADAEAEFRVRNTQKFLNPIDDEINRRKAILAADDKARAGFTDSNKYELNTEDGKTIKYKDYNKSLELNTEDGKTIKYKDYDRSLAPKTEVYSEGLQKPVLTDVERKKVESELARLEGQRGQAYLEASGTMNATAPKTMDAIYDAVKTHYEELVPNLDAFGAALVTATKRLTEIAQQNEQERKERDSAATKRAAGNTPSYEELTKVQVSVAPTPYFITTVAQEVGKKVTGLGG